MKSFAIIGIFGLVIGLATANTPIEYTDQISEAQTLSVPDYEVSFERGSYSILSPNYDESTILSDEELIDILKIAGFQGRGLSMAWAIVQKESTAKPYAHNANSKTGDNSYGLFQINMINDLGPARLKKHELAANKDLFNPIINARVAFKISDGGTNWKPWTTYEKAKSILTQFPG